jgi:hypothetical protein
MEDINKEDFELQLRIEDATEEELDRLTRQLLTEIKELNVESVELAKGGAASAGSKGDPITIGSIALEVLPVAIPSLIALVQAWVMRGQGRTVRFKGKGIEFEGSPEELQKLLNKLEKGRKNER